jgi:RimJ/RimL family protein N-acetyltransferase
VNEIYSNPRHVVFQKFDDIFFALSGIWLNDPELRLLTDAPIITENNRKEWYSNLSKIDNYRIFGVTINSVPIGVCGLKNITNGISGEYWGYIGEKNYWGRGIGTEMLNFILALAKESNLRSVFLWVIAQNSRAIKLYLKHGFEVMVSESTPLKIKMQKLIS